MGSSSTRPLANWRSRFTDTPSGLRDLGMCQAPLNAFITLLGIETLSLRMEKHVSNACAVAEWLETDPRVKSVTYAGLASSPYAERVKELYPKGAGALFTFSVQGRLRRMHQARRQLADFQPCRQPRGHEVARDPFRFHHTQATDA